VASARTPRRLIAFFLAQSFFAAEWPWRPGAKLAQSEKTINTIRRAAHSRPFHSITHSGSLMPNPPQPANSPTHSVPEHGSRIKMIADMIDANQARALLNWTQEALLERARAVVSQFPEFDPSDTKSLADAFLLASELHLLERAFPAPNMRLRLLARKKRPDGEPQRGIVDAGPLRERLFAARNKSERGRESRTARPTGWLRQKQKSPRERAFL